MVYSYWMTIKFIKYIEIYFKKDMNDAITFDILLAEQKMVEALKSEYKNRTK